MIIAGFDVASKTGWALFDTDKHTREIQCGILKVKVKDEPEQQAYDLARQVREFLLEHKPDLAVIEQPMHDWRKGCTKMIVAVRLNQLAGAVIGVCAGRGVKVLTPRVFEWRDKFLPEKPAGLADTTEKAPSWEAGIKISRENRKLWKLAAINRCLDLGIDEIPDDNAAEAVGLAFYGFSLAFSRGELGAMGEKRMRQASIKPFRDTRPEHAEAVDFAEENREIIEKALWEKATGKKPVLLKL